jgi:DNA-directed RNA polymerase beta subunit
VLTIKSDDIEGRSAAYDSIIKGEEMGIPGTPASFKVMLNTLRGLGLDVIPRNSHAKNDSETMIGEDVIND